MTINKEVNRTVLENLQVSNLEKELPLLVEYFTKRVDCFQAGQLSHKLCEWRKLTSDSEVLQTVWGEEIEFYSLPHQINAPKENKFSTAEQLVVEQEIKKLLTKGIIVKSVHEQNEFISPIFLRPKPDGSYRMILNLKGLNEYVVYRHFKMDSIWNAIRLMKPHCYMASVDLKDAYYSVRISTKHQTYLKFFWNGALYKFTCFPNGLALAPRKFTKLLKPVYTSLRHKGHLSSPYIDDSILLGYSFSECASNVIDTVKVLDNLNFVPHPKKSVFIPTQIIVFLGFVLNSINMTVSLTPEKAKKLKLAVTHLLSLDMPLIREVAQVIGLIISTFPGVMYGPLYFRITEGEKAQALKQNNGNFDTRMRLSTSAKLELQWWTNNVETANNLIYRPEPHMTMCTDASKIGWGCVIYDLKTGGLWTLEESKYHINYLELLAVYFGLKAHKNLVSKKHVKVLVDNTTVQITLTKMGTSHSPFLNSLIKTIWDWCIINEVWITVARIPGKENIEADNESRKARRNTEWCLDKNMFHSACEKLNFRPNIDLFASRINHQIKPYISYTPDPEAIAVNAFHHSWVGYQFYAFPPFCLISQVLQKIQKEDSEGLVIIPRWPTQSWWPLAMRMLMQSPIILPRTTSTLFLPSNPSEKHALHEKLVLLMCHLSGNSSKTEDFRQQLQKSSKQHGEQRRESNMKDTWKNGDIIVVNGISIPLLPL